MMIAVLYSETIESDGMTQSKGTGVQPPETTSWLTPVFRFCLNQKLLVSLATLLLVGWGLVVTPFDWDLGSFPRDPVPVGVIPDLGDNRQVVLTTWKGHTARDVENRITYPLTAALMGIAGVQTVRSTSHFGYSVVHIIFDERVRFHWARTRVLQRLNSLPPRALPVGVKPTLGPEATTLGQVFWYTLEAHDEKGKPVGGWDLFALRRLQDRLLRHALQSVDGVAEVASVGGQTPEYQVDVDLKKLRANKLTLLDVYRAIHKAGRTSQARRVSIRQKEFVVQLQGGLSSMKDLEHVVLRRDDKGLLLLKSVATVKRGVLPYRGVLDKNGKPTVGGVVIARYGANRLQVIRNIKAKLKVLGPRLPSKVLPNGRRSKVVVKPFYDRTQLIQETLQTLEEAISLEVLMTILVVLAMMMHLRSAMLIAGMLPAAVLVTFLAMKFGGVDANILALSGIAIAIGTLVDMGIVLSENIVQHLEQLQPEQRTFDAVLTATQEVGGAVLTATSTTVLSFLPLLMLPGAEGKLFRPLALTKTFALVAALLISLLVIPVLAHILFFLRIGEGQRPSLLRDVWLHSTNFFIVMFGMWIAIFIWWWMGMLILLVPVYRWAKRYFPPMWSAVSPWVNRFGSGLAIAIVGTYLVLRWMPLGHDYSYVTNFVFVVILVGGVLGGLVLFMRVYPKWLAWTLEHKKRFLLLPLFLVFLGANMGFGFDTVFSWIPARIAASSQPPMPRKGSKPEAFQKHAQQVVDHRRKVEAGVRSTAIWRFFSGLFPGLRKEFMPALDEGCFLLMPSLPPDVSIAEAAALLQKLDAGVRAIPEVSMVVGKVGRAGTALDTTSISVVEAIVHYKPKFLLTKDGRRVRQWRKHIHTPQDIWREMNKVTKKLGLGHAPQLQPIAARLMLARSGLHSPIGLKVQGPTLKSVELALPRVKAALHNVKLLEPSSIVTDKTTGKPHLHVRIRRRAMAKYNLNERSLRLMIQAALGGVPVGVVEEGEHRSTIQLRLPAATRETMGALQRLTVLTPKGDMVTLKSLTSMHFSAGPYVVQSEDASPVAYFRFEPKPGVLEAEAMDAVSYLLQQQSATGALKLPPGVRLQRAGAYETQSRSDRGMSTVIWVALALIALLLLLQFRSLAITLFVFCGVLVAWAGGFVLIGLYQQSWFLNLSFFGIHLRDIFAVQSFPMSMAVWVGFLALFGIATDDGVVMATYLKQAFAQGNLPDIAAIRERTLTAGSRRIRPCLMTTATTLLALFPILTASGRGANLMIPMAIPTLGGMGVALLTLFVVPVLYCWREEWLWRWRQGRDSRRRLWQFWRWFRWFRRKPQTEA